MTSTVIRTAEREHVVVGSPIGPLTIVARDGAISALYMDAQRHAPGPEAFGPPGDPAQEPFATAGRQLGAVGVAVRVGRFAAARRVHEQPDHHGKHQAGILPKPSRATAVVSFNATAESRADRPGPSRHRRELRLRRRSGFARSRN